MKTFIITNTKITTLYIGQLVTENALPKLLLDNCVTENGIEYIPYTEIDHEKYIAECKKTYSDNADWLDFYEVFS